MKTVYMNLRGDVTGGGPSVWAFKTAREFVKRGVKVIYEHPERADWAVAVIETGKLRRKLKESKTKILLRTDGIYNAEYNAKFNRAIRPDMTALHTKLSSDIPNVDMVVYQSTWSKERIEDEICKRERPSTVIHNGSDVALFMPNPRTNDGVLNLLHLGKMRDRYLMQTLVTTYKQLKQRGVKCKLLLVGSMDAGCADEFKRSKDDDIVYVGQFPNNKLTHAYNLGDIFLDVRQGASSNNVVSEAQACGLPVICASWGGSTDMVKDRQTGIVVQTGHWTYDEAYACGIADAVQEVATNLDWFKQNARKHAVEELSAERMVDKYIDAMKG